MTDLFKTYFRVALLLVVTLVCACKKDRATDPDDPMISPVSGTRMEMTLDSIYLYALQTYLWNDVLPTYSAFNPRQYQSSTEFNNYRADVFSLSQLKLNPVNGFPYERSFSPGQAKYSFIQSGSLYGAKIAAATFSEQGNDLGLNIAFVNGNILISEVYTGSPAERSGLTRGCKVLRINGAIATTALAQNLNLLNSVQLQVQKTDGSLLELSLAKAVYKSNPVLKTALLDSGPEKIGYLALADFSSLSSAGAALDQSFTSFAAFNPTSLIIDLRYNPGGYVETAEYLANLIAGNALNGKTMYVERFNATLQQGKATILKKQLYFDENGQPVFIKGRRATLFDVDFSVNGNTHHFAKKGSLQNIKNIYFIVTEQTASASEMLINCLKPYFNVKLIGSTTYGKPVGFFGINIDQYTLYLSNFSIENALGEGNYFTGIVPDVMASDDPEHDFADVNESCIAAAIALSSGKNSSNSNQNIMAKTSMQGNVLPHQVQADIGYTKSAGTFSGMIKKKLKLKTKIEE